MPPQGFKDEELLTPRDILQGKGIFCEIASLKTGIIMGADGAEVQAEKLVSAVDVHDYIGVAFIGGPGTVPLVNNQESKALARKFFDADKIVGAICAAPGILANGGILVGKKATSWQGMKETLLKSGALWQNEPVVTDGHIVTADGPDSSRQFGQALAGLCQQS
ncbi:MAG: protease I [Candidatus Berkelbacteria bacterium Licking1014_7]|uniref:Protease I n=1 Tax=Candidatus Berkelbacteria bacterium Licking1014_7 TaxID=2017147 RepID=A0A554LKT3_9BACT|nr:MAG: protease I [Candidatus Berkelbacteria bacterium Licking1014_7]